MEVGGGGEHQSINPIVTATQAEVEVDEGRREQVDVDGQWMHV